MWSFSFGLWWLWYECRLQVLAEVFKFHVGPLGGLGARASMWVDIWQTVGLVIGSHAPLRYGLSRGRVLHK